MKKEEKGKRKKEMSLENCYEQLCICVLNIG